MVDRFDSFLSSIQINTPLNFIFDNYINNGDKIFRTKVRHKAIGKRDFIKRKDII